MPVNPEILLISSVLRNGDLADAYKAGLALEQFHLCREEFAWIEEFQKRYRKVPSKESFKNKFPDFVIRRIDDTAHQVDEVRKSHIQNEMLDVLGQAADLISEGDIESAVQKTVARFIQISAATGLTNDTDILTDYIDILGDVQARKARAEETGTSGVPFGFMTLDDATGGANPGELGIIGARLGVGKSWLLQTMACNAIIGGYNVQFDALEQTRAQVGMRIHTLLSGKVGKQIFASNALMQGKEYNLADYRQFLKGLKREVGEARLHVADASKGQMSIGTLAAQIERNQPTVLYLDYITLMKKSSTEWQGVAELSGDLKRLATAYGISIISAAQLNREFGISRRGEPAGPEALSQSDSIGQDADFVATFASWSKSVLKGMLAKNRNGVGGQKFFVHFEPEKGIIKEIGGNAAQKLKEQDQDAADAEEER